MRSALVSILSGVICCSAAPMLRFIEAQSDNAVDSHVPPADGALGSTMTFEQLNRAQAAAEQPAPPLVAQPAGEPSPALKYRLYPARWELKPGSALLHFTRAQIRFLQFPGEQQLRWQTWAGDEEVPTDEQLAAAVMALQDVFDELHDLAMSENLTWDHRLRDLRGPQVYMYRLEDVQQARSMARLLVIKIRHQLKQGDFDGAISSISDGLRLAEFVGQGETLIQKLIGIAITSIMGGSIKEAIATRDCPNLYWALASVPHPLITVNDSVLWELNNIRRVLPILTEAETADWTEAQALRAWTAALDDVSLLDSDADLETSRLSIALAIASATGAEAARQRLIETGFAAERLEQMPVLQIVLIDAARELRRLSDDMGKAHLLPTPLALPLLEQASQNFQQVAQERMTSVSAAIASLLFPAVRQVKEAETRMLVRHYQLMNLEALRMHAATHDGELPESLEQLSPVPAIPDPYTGTAFKYQIETDNGRRTIVLTATGPTNYQPLRELRIRIE